MAASTARRPRRDAVRNHQLVVEAARELLGESGVDASMERIAARAGVGVGTVYRCFPGKESLVEELVKLVTAELIDAGEQALDHDDGTGLEAYLWAIGKSFAEHRRWASLLLPGAYRTEGGTATVRAQLTRLFDNAHEAGTVGPEVELGDVMVLIWAMRGLVGASGSVAPDAWKRYLDIHLAGLRSTGPLSETPAMTAAQLEELSEP